MSVFEKLAEEQIQAAIRRGDLDDLPGRGKPLALDDDSAVPEELRVAYRLLRNAGCLPPEQELRNEIRRVESLLHHVDSDADAAPFRRRLDLLKTRLALTGRDFNLLAQEAEYRDRLLRRLSRREKTADTFRG